MTRVCLFAFSPDDLLKDHLSLFWFRSPRLIFVLIQMMLMFQALDLAGFLLLEIPSMCCDSANPYAALVALSVVASN